MTGSQARDVVMCPICLNDIHDWDGQGYWEWNPLQDDYVPLRIPPDLTPVQLERHVRGAYVRCPASEGDADNMHFLPANYAWYDAPVMLGFVGLTWSGKTTLLAAMVGAIENGELQDYGITTRPLDYAIHGRFMREQVAPLLNDGKELPDTPENVRMFADAFLMSHDGGEERPVILFDVAGGELTGTQLSMRESKEFLSIVSGLVFVIDPDEMRGKRTGDESFRHVLSVVHDRARRGLVSAAIVLNKADRVRFEAPVARWLGAVASLDAGEFLRESADVYAYLQDREAGALTAPYQQCDKATLHVVSPAGGPSEAEVFPRGVRPRRVIRPLIALLAMTGVLTGPEAEMVGS